MNGHNATFAVAALVFACVATSCYAENAQVAPRAGEAPVVVAQASAPAASNVPLVQRDAFPPLQAGVRQAAAEGPTTLRRYVNRTRMIYNYYYYDFARLLPQEGCARFALQPHYSPSRGTTT